MSRTPGNLTPCPPFPYKEGGTENNFFYPSAEEAGTEKVELILWEMWNLSKVPQILSLC